MRQRYMQKWGIPTAILGMLAFAILGVLGFLLIERAVPEPPSGEVTSHESLRLALERERLALESLRFRAQIQADLAAAEAELAAAAAALPPAPAPADRDPAPAGEPIILNDINLVTSQPAALGEFVPDQVAYEEFSEPLEPYGDWYETDDYGPIWRPDAAYVDSSWAPYTNGSWGYSNYGWNWNSRDPFGWACDHYGRWLYISRHGWVWVPGRQWAPAWVSWRSCDRYIGWAPLPPCATWNRSVGIGGWVDAYCNIGPRHYNFVHRSHFGSRDCRSSIIDRSHNAGLVGRSKNVTRIHHGRRGVNNHGPGYDEVRSRSTQQIRRSKIDLADVSRSKREKIDEGRAARPGRNDGTGIERLRDVRRETGWGSADDSGEALRLRRQLVSEARGSLLEQSPPVREARGGTTLTAITKQSSPRRRPDAGSRLPDPQAERPEIIQVGTGFAPANRPPPGAAAGNGSGEMPDHFAAERAQREAALARQQMAMAERNRLVSERQSQEFAARQRIETQIRGRAQRSVGPGGLERGGQDQPRKQAITPTTDSAISTNLRAGDHLTNQRNPAPPSAEAAGRPVRSADTRASPPTLARSSLKQGSANAGSRSITRSRVDPRSTRIAVPSTTSQSRSGTRSTTSIARRSPSVTSSRPTASPSRQLKSTRTAVPSRRSVSPSRPRASSPAPTRSQPRPQPQRSSPAPKRSSPQAPSTANQSKGPGPSSFGSGRGSSVKGGRR